MEAGKVNFEQFLNTLEKRVLDKFFSLPEVIRFMIKTKMEGKLPTQTGYYDPLPEIIFEAIIDDELKNHH